MKSSTTINMACPNCGTDIIIDTMLLVQGTQFTCSNCQATIGLSGESLLKVEDAMNTFDEIRKGPEKK